MKKQVKKWEKPAPSYGVWADKSLGQHFLKDSRVISRIIEALGPLAGKTVIEIGPGPAVLTKQLILKDFNKLVLLEKDPRMVAILQNGTWVSDGGLTGEAQVNLGLEADTGAVRDGGETEGERDEACGGAIPCSADPRVLVLEADALDVDWTHWIVPQTVVIGNLPYNVGTEIVAQLVTLAAAGHVPPEHMVFMLQKEVVDRICAKPGGKTWGRLGVLCQMTCDVEDLFDVAPGCFIPAPKVVSSVVRLTPLPAPRFGVSLKALDVVLRAAFGQRRKMLRASLKGVVSEEALLSAGIEPTLRAEALGLEDWAVLAGLVRSY
ncbi:MAG: 16S rRNA (adenine(1518)-N(6)/adenine(1519)-N(6))-dimethyltransferase [Alphaproteobacteria bacterium CG_4_10_14_0_8_um_filter_53_9]|nr:MAG: 16S rRNA (adenine(1518)-N(6)/adenine(1519)-N(6))-dimethyltransferase [Alphaproteobacteria bacterium CG_4_10_14_0_8_um_filter_53_9]